MLLDHVAIESLVLDPANARKHAPKNLEAIKGSLARFGQQKPIVIDKNNVVRAGNGTLEAARQLGWDKISVYRTALEGSEATAFALADNRSAELAEWDKDILSETLKSLHDIDFDLGAIGFDQDDLAKMAPDTKDGLTDDDAVPENAETRVNPGDLWILGSHRLLCGDSTNVQHVERLMGGEKASVWLSDPPYGINHVETSQEKGQSKGYSKIANDHLQDNDFKDFIFSVISASLAHMKEGFAFYMWHAMKMQGYTAAAAAAGILFHRQLIWVKPQLVFGRGHYHWRHELCLMGWLQGKEPPFYGERNQTTVWECGRENDKVHPTQKPVEVLTPSILNHTKIGEVTYDPFLGSGSTLIACEKTGRRCFGMEIDAHYCDVVLKRWEDFTGKTASLTQAKDSGDGQASAT